DAPAQQIMGQLVGLVVERAIAVGPLADQHRRRLGRAFDLGLKELVDAAVSGIVGLRALLGFLPRLRRSFHRLLRDERCNATLRNTRHGLYPRSNLHTETIPLGTVAR